MASGSNKNMFFAQGSDDVFEQTPTQRDVPQTLESQADNNLSDITVQSTSLDSKEHSSRETQLRCEKGQKARDHFRSSGYGTGSNNSASVSSLSNHGSSLSQEAVAEEASAVPQSNQRPVLSIGASECVENDFKPKNGASSPPRMNALANSAVSTSSKQDSVTPPQVSLADSKSPAAVTSQFARRTGNMAGSSPVSTSTEDSGAVTGHKVSDTKQQSSIDHHLVVNTTPSQDHKIYSKDVQESLDLHKTSHENKMMAQRDSNQAKGVSQPTLSQVTLSHPTLSQTTLSHPTLSQATLSQPQTVIGNNNAEFQLKLQSHLSASSNPKGSPSRISPSSSSGRDAQNLKSKPPLIRQNVLRHQISETEDGSPPSRAQIQQEPFHHMPSARAEHPPFCHDSATSYYLPSGQTSELTSSCGCVFDNDLLQMLERCARCRDPSCENLNCVQIRKSMMILQQEMNTQVSKLTESSQILLQTMLHHVLCICLLPKCSFPWCGETIDSDDQFSRSRSIDHFVTMKQRIENYAEYCRLSNSSIKEYIKLSPTVSHNSMPVEGQDWLRLIMLGGSRRTFVALPVTSVLLSDSIKYWVIRKIPITSNLDHWAVYSKLRDIQHTSIASMLWAAKFENHMLVCSIFENWSLLDCLGGLPSQQFGRGNILNVMLQLTSATSHLHDLGIAYLYWTSKNILVECLPGDGIRVKICNFSCSVLLDHNDAGHLFLMLPPAITTPELRNDNLVELSSDVWGLGCLLHELVTGKPVWHEHRHLKDEDLNILLGNNPVPDAPKIYAELLPLFQACWEVDWTKRARVSDLTELLTRI